MTDQEINEAVARKLGWKINKDFQTAEQLGIKDFKEKWLTTDQIPNYCRSLEAAWEIMEKKRIALIPLKTGWLASSCELPGEEGESLELWYPTACMTRGECGCMRCEIDDICPMAICKAFLKLNNDK